jgi:hypothetical protein
MYFYQVHTNHDQHHPGDGQRINVLTEPSLSLQIDGSMILAEHIESPKAIILESLILNEQRWIASDAMERLRLDYCEAMVA